MYMYLKVRKKTDVEQQMSQRLLVETSTFSSREVKGRSSVDSCTTSHLAQYSVAYFLSPPFTFPEVSDNLTFD